MTTHNIIKCPHGNIIAERKLDDDGKLLYFRAGLPRCCEEEMRKPARGPGFIILGKQLRQNNLNLPPKNDTFIRTLCLPNG